MVFTVASQKTPTNVGTIVVVLKTKPASGEEPEVKSVMYDIEILDQDGRRINHPHDTGNLAPHLTANMLTQLEDFMTFIRTKAVSEFLP